MTDRDKVVKGLIDLRRYFEDKEWSDNRMDRQAAKVYWQTATDAIALLKEQKAVKPRSVVRHGANAQIQHFCGNCNTMLHGKPNYCSECGKGILW